MAALIQMFYESGTPVDFFRHDYQPNDFGAAVKKERGASTTADSMFTSFIKEKSIFAGDGSLLMPEEIISRAGAGQEIFLTIRALTSRKNKQYRNSKNLMHRMYGILIKGKTFLNVYYLGASGEMWWVDVERQAMAITQRYRKEAYPGTELGEGAGIFYVPDQEICRDFFFPQKKVRAQIHPPDAYAASYVLPLSANHADIRRMVLLEDWEAKCKSILFPDGGFASRFSDGCVGDAEAYILLANDMTKMKKIAPRVRGSGVIVIIHDWQTEIADRLYPDAKKIIFSAEEFRSLVATMEAEQ